MTLRLADRWVWDSWYVHDGDTVHVFYLQAPRSLGDPNLRHAHATVGHAVSRDLRRWEILPDALTTGPAGAWDDRSIWTGSVIRGPDAWYLYYTALATADSYPLQRIGLAVSVDLIHFERVGDGPCIELDERWYEPPASRDRFPSTWRDPWVFADPGGKGYHALITARRPDGPEDARAVVGHAVSAGLRHWEVRPPLPSPAGFGELEVLQTIEDDDGAWLAFSVAPHNIATERLERHGRPRSNGTYLARVSSLLGPFDVALSLPWMPASDRYAGRLVRHGGELVLMGFVDEIDGAFVGELGDPIPLAALDPTRSPDVAGA